MKLAIININKCRYELLSFQYTINEKYYMHNEKINNNKSAMKFSLALLLCSMLANSQVGINTTSPTAQLEVVTNGNTNATKAFSVINSNGVELLRISDDGTVTINSLASGGTVIAQSGGKLALGTTSATVGDIKYGIQSTDHNGWIKLDGRAVNTLTATQQLAAQTLGYNITLPDAANKVLKNKGTLNSTGGANSVALTQSNLPNVNFTGTTNTTGSHTHTYSFTNNTTRVIQFPVFGGTGNLVSGYSNAGTGVAGDHSHTVSVSSGGSATPLSTEDAYLSVNVFLYLGN